MKKLLLTSLFCALPFFGQSQIFQEDWDGNGPGIGAWTILDVDGQPINSAISDIFPTAWSILSPADISTLTSNVAASTSWYESPGTSNDWLISPQVTVSGANPSLVWQAQAQDPDFPDGYKVMLSTNGGNSVADFNVTLFTTSGENPSWIERSVDLSAYNGQNIRFAFVNNSTDQYILNIDNIRVVNNYVAPPIPDCPVLTLPANGATNVDYAISGADFSWNAPLNTTADSYDFYLDTTPNPTTLLGNTTSTDVAVTGLEGSTTYYWKVIAKNVAGESVGCTEYSFTTGLSPTAPYCGPLRFVDSLFGSDGDEPITLVNFAGINNVTDATAYTGNYHEIFLNQVANVIPGQSYNITLKGNTSGNFEDGFVVFIDWNQDADFDDAGETIEITQTISNSTGVDGIQAVQSITVPTTAVAGNTRMRVKKVWEPASDPAFLEPCTGSDYGQAEDYTINVGVLAVNESAKNSLKFYPNPVVDVLNMESLTNVKTITITDISGKTVFSKNINESKFQVNLSKLASGIYLVKTQTEKETKTFKIIKK